MTSQITASNLAQFSGSENLYFNPMYRSIRYTDGVRWLGKNGAGWLQDVILSHLAYHKKVRHEEFVCITLKVKDKSAVVAFTDGDKGKLASQRIEYTDFPLAEVKFFYTNGILMLAGEY
jgi:hypothetical protein